MVEEDENILDATLVEMDEGIPSSSKLKKGSSSKAKIDDNDDNDDNNKKVVKDCEFGDTVHSYVYIGKSGKRFSYNDLIERMVHFNNSNYALKALKMAVTETVELEYATRTKKNMRHPLVFTMMSIENDTLYFHSIGFGYGSVGRDSYKAMQNAKICREPYKEVYCNGLDMYPYQLYAYFLTIGVYVKHVKDDKLPKYMGVEYDEECDDSQDEWNIKSIRNMVLHEPPDDDIAPSMMLLVDWEVPDNVGVFSEVPNDKSVISWTAFHNLKDYDMLACYLRYRAKGIEGTKKILTRFPIIDMTEEEAYMNRCKSGEEEARGGRNDGGTHDVEEPGGN